MTGSDCRPATAAPEPTGKDYFDDSIFTVLIFRRRSWRGSMPTSLNIPTPVQAGAIPPALEGRDVLATAQTGTGKTLSFLIPIMEMLQKTQDSQRGAQALILLPTRELAMQVEAAFRAIRTSPSQTAALVVGGLHERSQLDAIRRGARLIVATPGRLEDFLKRKLVRLDQVKILVLDEVDRMLDMGFQPAIARIAATLPSDAPDALLLGHARGRGQRSGAQVSQQPRPHRDRLGAQARRKRRAAHL